MDEWINERMDGWINELMNKWMNGWMIGRMNVKIECIDTLLKIYVNEYIN